MGDSMIYNIDLDNYALSGHTGRINEDNNTASYLLLKTVKKCKECCNVLAGLCDGVELIRNVNVVEYDPNSENLSLYTRYFIDTSTVKNGKRYFLFNEDSKSFIELAAIVNKKINEGLQAIEKAYDVLATLEDLEVSTELKNELKNHVNACYVNVFDDCSMTTLELAGATARNVNDFVTAINLLSDVIEQVNKATFELATYTDPETLTASVIDSGNENLVL
jgi:hypothetical protein